MTIEISIPEQSMCTTTTIETALNYVAHKVGSCPILHLTSSLSGIVTVIGIGDVKYTVKP